MKAIAKPIEEVSLSVPAARLAAAAGTAVLVLLASLHVLSPEFDPAWRMVSEYANGKYAWVLSLMFLAWAVSSWALAFAIRPQVGTRAGRLGLAFLLAAGVGEAMAAVFDINHPLHGLAALIGIGSLPVAAMLISRSLSRVQEWSPARAFLLRTAHLTWISLVLMLAAFVLLMVTYSQAGGDMSAGPAAELPAGVIAVVGWANRFLIVAYCTWVLTVAGRALRQRA